MDEDGGEIEFLDEDADLVQQMVHPQGKGGPTIKSENQSEVSEDEDIEKKLPPLLIKRKQPKSSSTLDKKRKTEEPDSDYDPREDLIIAEKMDLLLERNSKRRRVTRQSVPRTPVTPAINLIRTSAKKATPSPLKSSPIKRPINIIKNSTKTLKMQKDPQEESNITKTPTTQHLKSHTITFKTQNNHKDNTNRNQYTVCIPDYEDPLCLPVRMIKMDDYSIKLLNRWNSLCLEHFKDKDQTLHIQGKETVGSKRMVVLRNVMNKQTGQNETTVWGKTSVENVDGQKKAIVYHGILPKYRDKVTLDYELGENVNKTTNEKSVHEVILTKESDVDGEMLVAYSLQDASASVYKLEKENDNEDTTSKDIEHKLKNMCETTNCKICAPCYQVSWRGATKVDQKNIQCAICKRSFVSMYNLLAHMKTHDTADVRKHKTAISKDLAKTPLTHNERQKLYLKRLKERNPEKFLLMQKRNAERTKRNRKKISEYTPSQRKALRKKWREKKRKLKLEKLSLCKPEILPSVGQVESNQNKKVNKLKNKDITLKGQQQNLKKRLRSSKKN